MGYNLNAELWAEYAIGMIVFAIRFFARWKTIGIRNFSWDDGFAAASIIFWTLETTLLYTCALFGNNIGLDYKTAELVPDHMVPRIRKGSQLAFAAWVFYILLVWSLKGVVIFLYSRITTGLWQHRLVKFVSAFCIITFTASILLHMCQCIPIQRNWQVKPFPGDSCTKRTLNYVVIEVLNILTDASIIIIPLPVVFAAKMPLYRKVILGILFSSGIFIIICAVLRAYYSVRSIDDLTVALGWASREIFVSGLAVCSPGIKPLFNKNRWFSTKKSSSADRRYGNSSNTHPWSSTQKNTRGGGPGGTITSVVGVEDREHGWDRDRERQFELSSIAWPGRGKGKRGSSGDSQEHIIESGEDPINQIQVTTEYHVDKEFVGDLPKGGKVI
ncbi:uncharacterized protein BJX67DRAFT_386262 [Aspergillus lucknowensis]|uniref:Rhodopsin domain-containing protein n=1 Tax=Aspergillus lucknowensis TaxID=176173 RepID=A0ABR4L8G1_9EURO